MQVLNKPWINTTTTTVQFNGKYFTLNDANIQIPNISVDNIPITVTAKKKKTMTIAAQYADKWECSYLSPQDFLKLNKEFTHNISPYFGDRRIERSIELDVIISESDRDLKYKGDLIMMKRGHNILRQLRKHSLIGRSDDISQQIKEYISKGVNQFMLAFQDPYDSKSITLFNDLVKSIF